MPRPVFLGLSAALLAVLAACGNSDTAASSTSATPPPPTSAAAPTPSATQSQTSPGGYIDYADYTADPQEFSGTDVVLFFNATWCPTCQEATKNLRGADFPGGLTVVSVDYDSNLDLRQKYGVTTQHTFVQVTPDGEQLKKFTGATTVSQIEDQLA